MKVQVWGVHTQTHMCVDVCQTLTPVYINLHVMHEPTCRISSHTIRQVPTCRIGYAKHIHCMTCKTRCNTSHNMRHVMSCAIVQPCPTLCHKHLHFFLASSNHAHSKAMSADYDGVDGHFGGHIVVASSRPYNDRGQVGVF